MSASRGLSQAISSSLAGRLLLKDTHTPCRSDPRSHSRPESKTQPLFFQHCVTTDPTPGYQKTGTSTNAINPMATSSSSPPTQQHGRTGSSQSSIRPCTWGPAGSTIRLPSGAKATKAYLAPDRNSFMIDSRSFWGMSPCMDDTVKLASLIFSVSQSTYRSEHEMCLSTQPETCTMAALSSRHLQTQRKLSPTNCWDGTGTLILERNTLTDSAHRSSLQPIGPGHQINYRKPQCISLPS